MTNLTYRLRFDLDQVNYWAAEYLTKQNPKNSAAEHTVEHEVGPRARTAGFLTKQNFLTLCRWKSPRIVPRCEENSAEYIQAVTSTAFSAPSQRLRIEVLPLLQGVQWPTASVLLHFCTEDRYPILDFRALWSLSIDVPTQYTFDFWWAYVEICRNLASRADASMRTLDRALWQYSNENQP